MRNDEVQIWAFHTKQFTVRFLASPEYHVDLSWDDGSTREQIESGDLCAFVAHVECVHRPTGAVLADDYLGGCIYANPSDFIDHRGIKAHAHCGSYFSDLVRNVCADARKALASMPRVRAA